jgi:hypothetical protein
MFLVSTTKKYEVEKKSISTFIRSRMRPPSPPVRPHHPARTHNPARRGPPPSSVDHAATSPSAGVTTQESRCVNFAKNLKLFVCFGVLSIFEPNC